MNEKQTPTADYIDRFETVLEENSSLHKKGELEKIVKNTDKITKLETPIIFDKIQIQKYVFERSKALSELVKEYVTLSLGVEFPELDSEIFHLKRHLVMTIEGKNAEIIRDYVNNSKDSKIHNKTWKVKDKEIDIEAPLFVHTNIDKIHESLPVASYRKRSSNGYYSSTKKVSITAKFPGGIDSGVKEVMREALARYHKTIHEVYSHPILGEVLMQDEELKKILNNPEMSILWIPKAEYLNVTVSEEIKKPKNNDPALILNVLDKKYIIRTWNIKEEDPLDRYISAFTKKSK